MKKKNKMSSEKAAKKAIEKSNKVKIAKEVKEKKEHIDNMVVLSTAVALVGAFALLYLKQFHVARELQTVKFLNFFSLILSIGIVACVVLYFVKKKNKNFLVAIPYLAVTALVSMFLAHFRAIFQKLNFVKFNELDRVTQFNRVYLGVFIAIAVYFVVSLIYFGIQSHKLNKMYDK